MKKYNVEITREAELQMQRYLEYLLIDLKSEQSYKAVKEDYLETLERMTSVAGSLRICENPKFAKRKIRKILFSIHRYVVLYRLYNDTTDVVIGVYHTMQDYEIK